jgi:gamma-polyglutamate biosynthesis protein CapA
MVKGEPVQSHEPINLIAVGDICPGDHLCMGFGMGTLSRVRGPAFALQHVAAMLREGDIVFGNCEGVFSDIGADRTNIDTMEFRGTPAFAEALRESGFTVMTVANNHVGEHGLEVMNDTIENLKAAGIDVIGLRDKGRVAAPLIQEIKGVRVGWLAYTWIVSKHTAQDREMLAWTKGKEVAEEVAALRPEVEFLIVTPHWGREFVTVPPQSVIDQAHAMADAGADLILGHHPHVLQGIEQRGKCLIVYSLGNFLFDMPQSQLRRTALFRCTIESGTACNSMFVPLRINRRFQPMLATPRQAARILQSIEQSARAINDPDLAPLRDEARTRRLEAAYKRRMFRSQMLHLAISLGRMGPRIAYQKLCRRLPVLPRWL